jgi:AraC-like DNA-binding protein
VRALIQAGSNADGRWEMATCPSAPGLRSVVPMFVGYSETSRRVLRRMEVPHPNVTVILNLGAPLAIDATVLGAAPCIVNSFVAGLFDAFVVTENTGDAAGIELNLTPLGAWRLLGTPMHELTNRVVSLNELLGRSAARLLDQLRDTCSWDRRFELLDSAITARIGKGSAPPCEVQWAWDRLTDAVSPFGVGAIAAELRWSRRRLGVAFREYIGMTPKAVARVTRFDRVVRRIRCGQPFAWSALAFDMGYVDQSHLIREFSGFAGLSPTEFLHRQRAGILGIAADTL